jgi:hypothetical protein
MPSPENLLGSIIFGGIGMAAFVYGKKSASLKPVLIGIALMIFPYFVPQTWLLYLIGSILTGSLFVFRG